jgi:hypothetical protein
MNIELNIVCLFLKTRVSLNRGTLNKLCLIVVQSKAVVVIIQILYVTFSLKYHKGQFVQSTDWLHLSELMIVDYIQFDGQGISDYTHCLGLTILDYMIFPGLSYLIQKQHKSKIKQWIVFLK